jgi:hypothetical protein
MSGHRISHAAMQRRRLDAWGSWIISMMLKIGEVSGHLPMVMRSSGHMNLEPT